MLSVALRGFGWPVRRVCTFLGNLASVEQTFNMTVYMLIGGLGTLVGRATAGVRSRCRGSARYLRFLCGTALPCVQAYPGAAGHFLCRTALWALTLAGAHAVLPWNPPRLSRLCQPQPNRPQHKAYPVARSHLSKQPSAAPGRCQRYRQHGD
jgi:hypothetical protein